MEIQEIETKIEMLNNNDKIIKRACLFLEMDTPVLYSTVVEEKLKELCIIKVCKSIGIKCAHNYRNGFLDFFSSVMGEALAEKLGLNISVACPDIRFVKYNHINLITEVKLMLDNNNKDEAFIDAFNFLQNFKFLATKLEAI